MQAEAGIKCWVCNSFNDLGCGDPFDNSSFPITDCDAELNKRANLQGVKATMCRKLVQKSKAKRSKRHDFLIYANKMEWFF